MTLWLAAVEGLFRMVSGLCVAPELPFRVISRPITVPLSLVSSVSACNYISIRPCALETWRSEKNILELNHLQHYIVACFQLFVGLLRWF